MKYLRFIVALIVLPIMLPAGLLSALICGVIELLGNNNWDFYKDYHLNSGWVKSLTFRR